MTQRHAASTSQDWWIAVIAYRGIVSHVRACASHEAAVQVIATYLRKHHRYTGEHHLPAIADWVAQHEPDFDVQIVEQDVSPCPHDDAPLLALPHYLTSRNDDSFRGDNPDHGFIVLTREVNPDTGTHRIEASAFAGSLQHNWAGPLHIGRGKSITAALRALNEQL